MALLIDMIILLLLLGTLVYASLVDRRVRALMAAMQALAPVVDKFSMAVDRTEDSVKSLRAESTARVTPKREEEPPLTRPVATGSVPRDPAAPVFKSARNTQANGTVSAAKRPSQLPPGIARVTGKSDLVRGFFDTIRSREA